MGAAISTAFKTCSPFFGFLIELPWAESGPVAEHYVPPTVKDPAQTGLMVKGSQDTAAAALRDQRLSACRPQNLEVAL